MTETNWNEILAYADIVCQRLNREGLSVSITEYNINGQAPGKGLHLNLLNSKGYIIREYATGVGKSIEQMIYSLEYNADRLKKDLYPNLESYQIEFPNPVFVKFG